RAMYCCPTIPVAPSIPTGIFPIFPSMDFILTKMNCFAYGKTGPKTGFSAGLKKTVPKIDVWKTAHRFKNS
ncbi:MAG: hypothetical protein LBD65_05985, partial [Spirochaetaceae bacterium]|nr:hypothetical protein [Spirochaetaceae bacterium]